MITKEDATQFVADAATNPKVVVAVSTATSGIGFSTAIGWLEKGLGAATSGASLTVLFLMIRKLLLESEKLKLENKALRDAEQSD